MGRLTKVKTPEHRLVTQKILRRDWSSSLFTNFFLTLRWLMTPYEIVASFIKKEGKLLDLGCGHGLFDVYLALSYPQLEIRGVDHDQVRLEAARRASHGITNLKFEIGSVAEAPEYPSDTILMIDVLHYFSYPEQEQIITRLKQLLLPGGILLIREVGAGDGVAGHWNNLYEKISSAIGFTKNNKHQTFTRSNREWQEFFTHFGFRCEALPCSHPIFKDYLYVLK